MKTFLGMLVGLVIAIAGLLAFKTYTITTTNDDLWQGINTRMPSVVRGWSCTNVQKRLAAKGDKSPAPKGCEGTWN